MPVLPALAQELRTSFEWRRSGYLFETNRNDHYSVRTVQSVVKAEAREAGIEKPRLSSSPAPFDRDDPARFRRSAHRSGAKVPWASATLDDPDLRRDQYSSAWRKLSSSHERRKVLNPAAATVACSGPNNRLEEPERLPDEIDDDTLRKFFTLTRTDLEQVDQCRGPANRLGFAVQLCTLRWHGYFFPDTRAVPRSVVEMIGSQLGLLPISLDDYPQNEKTRFEHLERIREHLGFIRCDAPQRERLLNHLTAIAQGLTRATALRQAAHRWLKQEQIVRPGHTTLRDVIVSAREAALQNVYAVLARSYPRTNGRNRSAAVVAAPVPESPQLEAESAIAFEIGAVQDGSAEGIPGITPCLAGPT